MKYAGINKNDLINGEGVCVSIWFQGCPHRCSGCHNPETWNPNGGQEIEYNELEQEVLNAINKNDIIRNLSLLGGEPFAEYNLEYTIRIAAAVKQRYPNIKIYCWSGYTLEQIIQKYGKKCLKNIDVLIDGPFILEQRDVTLKLRGSKNQRILQQGLDF